MQSLTAPTSPTACGSVYTAFCDYGATANNQLTINPKDRKNAFSGILTHVHSCLPGLTLCHAVQPQYFYI